MDYNLNIDTQKTHKMDLDNILSCFLQKIADMSDTETIFDIFESTIFKYSDKSTQKNILGLFSIINYILQNAQLNNTKSEKRSITFHINKPKLGMSLCTTLVDKKYLYYAKQIIQYRVNHPRINDETKKYIQSLFDDNTPTTQHDVDDNTPTTQDDGDNELFKYEDVPFPKVTLCNITTRYYKKGVFRNKNLYTNEYFKRYIMYIIDELIKKKLIKSPNEMTTFNCYLFDCPDAYEGIWNNLSVCDVIKKMNRLHQEDEKSKIQISKNNEYFDSTTHNGVKIGANILTKQIMHNTNESNVYSIGESFQNEPVQIIFKPTRGEDFLNANNIHNLNSYTYSQDTINYVDTVIGDKTGRFNTHLSRIYRPRTWMFTRKLGRRQELLQGGKPRRVRTRRKKTRKTQIKSVL